VTQRQTPEDRSAGRGGAVRPRAPGAEASRPGGLAFSTVPIASCAVAALAFRRRSGGGAALLLLRTDDFGF
jgi:hypothetical protein